MNTAVLLVFVEILFSALFVLFRLRFQPIFHKGDVVDWDFDSVPRLGRNSAHSTSRRGNGSFAAHLDSKDFVHPAGRYGNGPFIVDRTWSVDFARRKSPKALSRPGSGMRVVSLDHLSHSQFVVIVRRKDGRVRPVGTEFSGAYFKRVHHAHNGFHRLGKRVRHSKR